MYLFAGSTFYPAPAPGDFVFRGTEDECRAVLAKMDGWVVRHWATNEITLDVDVGYLGDLPDDVEGYARAIDWWTIVDDDMRVVAASSDP